MKKILLIVLMLLFMPLICLGDDTFKGNIVNTAINNKKDPHLIQLNHIKDISQNSYSQKLTADNKDYASNKKIMNDDYYNLYKIMDKILRANNLYYQNWRLSINSNIEDINAFSTSANLVVINSSLYDSLCHDDNALAFVISHELAHFLLNHHQISLENNKKIEDLEKSVSNMQYESQRQSNLASINDAIGNSYASLGNSISSLGYSVGTYVTNAEINKIYAQERTLEYDADAEAVILMLKAGFDTDNMTGALEFLSKLPNVFTNRSTHPPINDRLKNIEYIMQIADLNELKTEGKHNIYNSAPLKPKKSSDGKSLVILKPSGKISAIYNHVPIEQWLLKKAYGCYINNDSDMARIYFEDAYAKNPQDYIPALYLSYIYEHKYYENNDKKMLKLAGRWSKKAYKIKPDDKNTKKQRDDIIAIFKELKNSKETSKSEI